MGERRVEEVQLDRGRRRQARQQTKETAKEKNGKTERRQ